ncbi:uncharacterized protein ACHE_51219A [Aspergillus chevalieri]|uniref:Uncharacterized protein n=1 Tax=Aspergillus chevalieri TaxID=182096 RepID=A0A7R7ZQT0_ASPCH|nr:uncharacterized protein ACHE_51219A [Aspergillus chevalieri]BCR90021.1 hypothetical protein ACHE_51219A [Aspergillus chevalieri]
MATSAKDSRKDPIETQTQPVDVEAWEGENPVKPAPASNQAELTPNEAFKWNVEGDQSPCMSIFGLMVCDHR